MRRVICLIILLSTLFSCTAYADEVDGWDEYIGCDVSLDDAISKQETILENDKGKTLREIAIEHSAILAHYNPYEEEVSPDPIITVSKEDSLDDIVEKLFEKYDCQTAFDERFGHVTIGYYNTVSGEEYYYDGDRYLVGASLFKIFECMIMADKINNSELAFDTVIGDQPYSYYQYRMLTHSDNDRAWTIFNYLGGYASFKQLQQEYLGDNPFETMGYEYNNDNYYNSKEIINALKQIFSDPNRFDGIIQNMLQANPYEYARMFQRDYVTAQKYGFVSQTETTGSHTYINTAGITYTDEPFLFCIFTDNITKGNDLIADLNTALCEYTNLHPSQNSNIEEEIIEVADENIAVGQNANIEEIENNKVNNSGLRIGKTKMSVTATIVMGLIAAFAVLAMVFIFRSNSGAGINGIWAGIGIAIAGLALIMCVVGTSLGTVFTRTFGSPQATVQLFYDSLISGEYQTAYSCLSDYSELGLENEPETNEGKLIFNALRESWSYSLNGDAETDRLSATQAVTLRYLDLSEVEADAQNNVNILLQQIVDERDRTEVYDSANHYLDSVIEEVYSKAIELAVANASSHYKTMEINIDLQYQKGKWYMQTSDEIIAAILGGNT